MLLSKYALQRALETLTPATFYNQANGLIFGAIGNLVDKSKPIDLTTLTAELDQKKVLVKAGGVEYISTVINVVPSAANVEEYIRIVEEKATLRRLIDEATMIVAESYNSTDSLDEILDEAEKKILNVVKVRKGTEFQKIQEVLSKAQANLERLSENKGSITGISTGLSDIDKVTLGLHPNELIIIAARPAMGKTAFAVNLAINMAESSKKPIAFFNLEMAASELVTRMIANVGQLDLTKLSSGRLQNNDWVKVSSAISRLGDTKIMIDDTPGLSISEIRAKARRLSSESGLGAIIVDYLQLISGGARYAGNRQQEVSEISRSLKMLAKELEVPVIALAQLSRSVESRDDKRPILSDLRESGSIEQDADIVAFLYREDYYSKEVSIDENTSKSEFIIRKHRSGPNKTVDLVFKRNTSTFVNYINKE
jgi:replicative DNA helicase